MLCPANKRKRLGRRAGSGGEEGDGKKGPPSFNLEEKQSCSPRLRNIKKSPSNHTQEKVLLFKLYSKVRNGDPREERSKIFGEGGGRARLDKKKNEHRIGIAREGETIFYSNGKKGEFPSIENMKKLL